MVSPEIKRHAAALIQEVHSNFDGGLACWKKASPIFWMLFPTGL
jgi:hypothetical protein